MAPNRIIGGLTAALIATTSLVAVTPSQAATASARQCVGTIEPGTLTVQNPDIYIKGDSGVDLIDVGKNFYTRQYGSYGKVAATIHAPDDAKAGDQFYIEIADGMTSGVGKNIPIKDKDGNTVAHLNGPWHITAPPDSGKRWLSRLVITWTDYVETHANVTATISANVQAISWNYPLGYPSERAPGTIHGCDGTSVPTSVRADRPHASTSLAAVWWNKRPSGPYLRLVGTPSTTNRNIITTTITAQGDTLRFSPDQNKLAVHTTTWTDRYKGSDKDDKITGYWGNVVAKDDTTRVNHEPTTPGETQVTVTPDGRTLTIKTMVNANQGVYFDTPKWLTVTPELLANLGNEKVVIAEEGTTSVARASELVTFYPRYDGPTGEGNGGGDKTTPTPVPSATPTPEESEVPVPEETATPTPDPSVTPDAVTPEPSEFPSAIQSPSPEVTATPAAAPEGSLPKTGAAVGIGLLASAGLIGAGTTLIIRRKHS